MKSLVLAFFAAMPMLAVPPLRAQALTESAEISAVRSQVVGSMLLTDRLSLDADGAVKGYVIDHSDKVPAQVLGHVARYVPRWRVVGLRTLEGEKCFSVRVIATPHALGYFALSLAAASISERQVERDMAVSFDGRRTRPTYPRSHARRGTTGMVYMLVKVGPDGKVQDLQAEQVNLDLVGTVAEIAQARADFAAHSAAAARQGRFRLPTSGPLTGRPYSVVRVPVSYRLDWKRAYGQWEYFVPGPRRVPSWVPEAGVATGAGDPDVPQLLGMGPRLGTPLEPPAG